jgi:hypothetical protein
VSGQMSGRDFLLDAMIKDQNHLPEVLKVFHENKKIFQAIEDSLVKNRRESDDFALRTYGNSVPWSEAMVYTVDVFLAFMAHHGYTLQRSSENLPFYDLEQTVAEWEKLKQERLASERSQS